MKHTAVEWFYDKIKSHFEHDGDLLETLNFTKAIAKQKEKQQIIDSCNQIEIDAIDGMGIHETITKGEQYYNETFNK